MLFFKRSLGAARSNKYRLLTNLGGVILFTGLENFSVIFQRRSMYFDLLCFG